MTEQNAVEAQVAAMMTAAQERPGILVTTFDQADRNALQALADRKTAEAAALVAQSQAGGTTGGRP